jgi:hypothetical protein
MRHLHFHRPDSSDITEALEILANVAANAFIALVFLGGIVLGLSL